MAHGSGEHIDFIAAIDAAEANMASSKTGGAPSSVKAEVEVDHGHHWNRALHVHHLKQGGVRVRTINITCAPNKHYTEGSNIHTKIACMPGMWGKVTKCRKAAKLTSEFEAEVVFQHIWLICV